jgi:hypothetical protein
MVTFWLVEAMARVSLPLTLLLYPVVQPYHPSLFPSPVNPSPFPSLC